MESTAVVTRPCPLCREEIRADAVRCKHCQATVAAENPGHGGVCPFCKEDIHPDALRCKHCHPDLAPAAARGGCCGGGGQRAVRRRYRPGGVPRQRFAAPTHGITSGPTHPDSGCPWWIDDDGWFGILVDWDDTSCTYDPC
jgi:hypothetical protein